MADKQIPNLVPVIGLDGSEELELVQGGVSSRVTIQQIADFATTGIIGVQSISFADTGLGPAFPDDGDVVVTGVLEVDNGGTGGGDATTGFNTLSPLTVRGDLLTRDATNNIRLPVGTIGQVLTTADGIDASWQDPGSVAVVSINVSGGATGMTFTGGPITGSGTITMAGTLDLDNGGTGQTTKLAAFDALSPVTTRGDLIVRNASNNVRLPLGAAGRVLTSDGTDAVWAVSATLGTVTSVQVAGGTTGLTFSGGPITSSGTITMAGTLAIANGGTGQTTAVAAFNALSPVTTRGDVIVRDATGNVRLPIGLNNQVLSSNGTDVVWSTPSGTGTVTSVQVAGGTTGLTFSGGPITTAGTITMAGTLAIANGGTGAGTAVAGFNALSPLTTRGDLVTRDATNNVRLALGTSGFVLSSNGTDAVWAAPATSGTVTSVQVAGGTTGLTFSGGPITSSGTITMSGTLAIANGGTGATTKAAAFDALSPVTTRGDLIVRNATTNTRLPIGGSGMILSSDGTDATWAALVAVTSVNVSGGSTGLSFAGGPITSTGTITMSGTLDIDNGGTGQTTKTAAFDALSPVTTRGDLIVRNASNNVRLALGASGRILTSDGTDAVWSLPATSGTVTSVQVAGGTTGLTFSGGPITSTGTITMAGTLAVANGGTGGTTQATARTGLGLGTMAVEAASDYVPNTRTVSAGTGLTGGGDLSANRTITLDTPGTVSGSSTNSAGPNHTHNVNSTDVYQTGVIAVSNTGIGAVGMLMQNSGTAKNPGETIGGAGLTFSSANTRSGAAVGVGTWECHGRVTGDAATNNAPNVTCWLRIA
jgi:hypothetical protein